MSKLSIEELDKSIVMLELMVESISAKVIKVDRIDYTEAQAQAAYAAQLTQLAQSVHLADGKNKGEEDMESLTGSLSTADFTSTTTSSEDSNSSAVIGNPNAEPYYYAVCEIETSYDDTSKIDVRIAVCGNVDAGS